MENYKGESKGLTLGNEMDGKYGTDNVSHIKNGGMVVEVENTMDLETVTPTE